MFVFLIILSVSLILLFLVLASFASMLNIDKSLFTKLILACGCFSSFISTYFVSKLNKKNSVLIGFVCGFVFATLITITTFMTTLDFLNLFFLIKIVSVVLAGVLGGIFSKVF